MPKQVEVLAPAGSYDSMVAAIAAGADAVYMGGSRFGARAYADNPDEERLLEAIDYAHLHGCKLYMTVNTLVKEEELGDLFFYLKPYYERGLDAVIVQDMGVLSYIRHYFPDLPIHASTQMTITGHYGAKMLADLGASRVVTARELSLEEIRKIRDQVDVEIESFVHGALCYCYSGQCLLSSMIGGRSGNRGRCAQPCRLPYQVKRGNQFLNRREESYVLSLKDLCTLDLIPDMLEAGIYSLKIEGRMKSPRYTAGVVSIYRKYVELYLNHGRDGYRVEDKDRRQLLDLFDRGGFTEGYYEQHNGRDMVALGEKPAFRQGNEELFRYLDETYVQGRKQEPIEGEVCLIEGQPSCLKLRCGEAYAEVHGEVPQQALKQPITEERLRRQMEKTGNTPFVFQNLNIRIVGDVFLPVQALNELRRAGLEALEAAVLKPYHREQGNLPVDMGKPATAKTASNAKASNGMEVHVLLEQPDGLETVLKVPEVGEIIIESDGFLPDTWEDAVLRCHNMGKRCVLAMPAIFRTHGEAYFKQNSGKLKRAGFDGLLIRSLEEVGYVRAEQVGLPLLFDYHLYTMNHMAAEMMRQQGADRLTLPLELNSRELEQTGCEGKELVVYGYLPVMISAQCIRKTVEGCSRKPELIWLKDRMGKELPVRNHCVFCYNTIYNTAPVSLLDQEKLMKRLSPASVRLQFSIETPREIERILQAYVDGFLRGIQTESPVTEFTRGHFKRGVE